MKILSKHSERIKGFTLIELLVVIVVIGILATIALVSFMASQSQTRDANRKSDINQYKIALAQYASKNQGYYPKYENGASLTTTVCNDMDIPNCPPDPQGVSYMYRSNASGSQYAIWADMESTGDYWINCSTGETGNGDSVPGAGATCTVGSVSGGCEEAGCSASCTFGGSCNAMDQCVCDEGGGEGECTDSDLGVPGPQYIGGYVNDINGEVTVDWCDPSHGSVIEQGCQADGTAYETPIGCDPGTLCVDDPTGSYCPSGGGGCAAGETLCVAGCTDVQTDPNNCGACAENGGSICSPPLDQCVSGTCTSGGGGCSETDSGNDPNQGGSTTGGSPQQTSYDACTPFGGLTEYWCDPNVPGAVSQTYYQVCPGGFGTPCQPGPNGDFCP